MLTVDELTERILYRLSLEARARELATRVLARLGKLIGDLPASADYHRRDRGGLHQHSLEVALKMLEEFKGSIIMERRADGSVDSFQTARAQPAPLGVGQFPGCSLPRGPTSYLLQRFNRGPAMYSNHSRLALKSL